MKAILFSILFLFILSITYAQNRLISISGTITDQATNNPLIGASIICYRLPDSTIIKVVHSTSTGSFLIDSLLPIPLSFRVSYIGYSTEIFYLESQLKNNSYIRNVQLKKTGVMLSEISIISEQNPISKKNDSIKFDAAYYQTSKVEMLSKLLSKMPGFEISNTGIILFNGKPIKKILINGKKYFGDNINIALENIPADLINKIDVFEESSNRDIITGNINQKEQILNIEIKPEKTNKASAQLMGGIGLKSRYATSLTLNKFGGQHNWSIIGSGNNMNKNIDGYGNSDRFITLWNTGINYSGNIGKKINLSSSYRFEDKKEKTAQLIERKNFLDNSNYFLYKQDQSKNEKKTSQNISFDMDALIDSSFKINWNNLLSIDLTNSELQNSYTTISEETPDVNGGSIQNRNNNNSLSINGNITASKQFKKNGGTLGFEFSYSAGQSKISDYNVSNNTIVDSSKKMTEIFTNQKYQLDEKYPRFRWTISYNQHLSKKSAIFYNLGYIIEKYPSQKKSFDYDSISKQFNIPNDSLSVTLDNKSKSIYSNLIFHSSINKLEYSIGVKLINVNMNSKQHSNYQNNNFLSNSIYPSAYLKYAISSTKTVTFTYDSKLTLPTFTQLNPLPDNLNPTIIRLGNPQLRSGYGNDFYISFYNFNPISQKFISLSINAQLIDNQIIDANWVNNKGNQIFLPVNVDGIKNYLLDISWGIPIIRNVLNIDLSTSIKHQMNAFIINEEKVKNINSGIDQKFGLKYINKKKSAISLTSNLQYNLLKNSNSSDPTKLLNYSINLDNNIKLSHYFNFSTNLIFSGIIQDRNNISSTIVNSSLSFDKLFKGQISIQGSVFDIFNRNNGIQRTIGPNYIEDTKSLTFGRTILLSAIIKLN